MQTIERINQMPFEKFRPNEREKERERERETCRVVVALNFDNAPACAHRLCKFPTEREIFIYSFLFPFSPSFPAVTRNFFSRFSRRGNELQFRRIQARGIRFWNKTRKHVRAFVLVHFPVNYFTTGLGLETKESKLVPIATRVWKIGERFSRHAWFY